MNSSDQNNTAWLAEAIFNDSFNWEKSFKTSLPVFFNYVTLHDSFLEALNLVKLGEAILVIDLDAFWNQDFTQKKDAPHEWPYLVIKFPNLFSISCNSSIKTNDFRETVAFAESIVIERAEISKLKNSQKESLFFPKEIFEKMLRCKELNKTTITNIYGGCLELLHDSEIHVLLIQANGVYLNASLEGLKPFDNLHQETPKTMIAKWREKLFGK